MSYKLYYTAPSDDMFNEIKGAAMLIWESYDNTYGYATEKLNRVRDIQNIDDNYMYIVAMFDSDNQDKLFGILNPLTTARIRKALE